MKLFLPLVLFLVVACGTEIGTCSESEEVGISTDDSGCEEPTDSVPPYEEEPVNG